LKILLTGAAGFTGRHFEAAARAAGHEVIALQADLTDPAALKAEVLAAQPAAVVHLAAISFVGHADDTAFYAVNTVGSTHLLAAVAALPQPPHKVLLASSANVYGNCDVSPIAESQPPAPVNHYAMSKLAMEQMARTYMDRLPIVITRPFNYTGVGHDDRFVLPKLVSHFARKADHVELGNLDVEREFNDVRMVVQAYLRLLEHGLAGQTYNVCTGQPIALRQAIQMLVALTGHSPLITVNPAFVRANEIQRLCGSPDKLIDAIGPLPHYTLKDTLSWMLGAASAVA